MLGPHGVNLVEVKKTYDTASVGQRGDPGPAVITVFEDRSFDLQLKTPPTSFLVRKAIRVPALVGGAAPKHAPFPTTTTTYGSGTVTPDGVVEPPRAGATKRCCPTHYSRPHV
jgi:ribosomal protein L11